MLAAQHNFWITAKSTGFHPRGVLTNFSHVKIARCCIRGENIGLTLCSLKNTLHLLQMV